MKTFSTDHVSSNYSCRRRAREEKKHHQTLNLIWCTFFLYNMKDIPKRLCNGSNGNKTSPLELTSIQKYLAKFYEIALDSFKKRLICTMSFHNIFSFPFLRFDIALNHLRTKRKLFFLFLYRTTMRKMFYDIKHLS